jgi:hypothetical protein
VVERLERSGLAPRFKDSVTRASFAVPGAVYRLGRAELELFLYEDTLRLKRDVAAMDTLRVAPAGQTGSWPVPPRLLRSGNLLGVLLTLNDRQAERVALALTAGAPQPDSSVHR